MAILTRRLLRKRPAEGGPHCYAASGASLLGHVLALCPGSPHTEHRDVRRSRTVPPRSSPSSASSCSRLAMSSFTRAIFASMSTRITSFRSVWIPYDRYLVCLFSGYRHYATFYMFNYEILRDCIIIVQLLFQCLSRSLLLALLLVHPLHGCSCNRKTYSQTAVSARGQAAAFPCY